MDEREGCALVTGASRGIGAAIAKALAADGWAVGVNYRSDKDAAEKVVGEIEGDGGRAVALGADVVDPDAAEQLFSELESHFDAPVLVLINNAGISRDDLTPSLDDEQWNAVIDTDLTAAFRLTRRALKVMLRARNGRIVNISSVAGLGPTGSSIAYAVSKAGLIHLTKCMAVALAPEVLVNCVAPGLLEGTRATANLRPEQVATGRKASLLGKAADKDDVADQVVTMCRTETMTGQTMVIDSGRIFH